MLNLRFTRSSLAVAVAIAAAHAPAQAQQLEEVIVTAQKRAESLQDVPISVSAIQGQQIQDAGIPDMAALADYVPNLYIARASVNTNIYLRGVGSGNNQGFEQSVGMYIDGVYMGRGRQYRSGFLDVERVEVLRGPQGTLFGRNTVAGAVNITTNSNQPGDELEGQLQASFESNSGQLYEGFVGGGVTDTLGMRLAFRYREADGYVDNSFLNTTDGDVEEGGVRLSVSWIPTDKLDINAKFSNSFYDQVGSPSTTLLYLDAQSRDELFPNRSAFASIGYSLTDTFYPEIAEQSQRDFITFKDNGFGQSQEDGFGIGRNPDSSEQEFNNFVLNVNYELGNHTLTSVTGYTDYEYIDGVDVDWLPLQFIHRDDDQTFDQWSQELRLTSPGGEFFDYVVGAYWDQSTMEFDRLVTLDGSVDGLTQQALGVNSLFTLLTAGAYTADQIGRNHLYQLDSESWALFAQGTFNLTDYLRVTVGVRYTEEDKEVDSRQVLVDSITGMDTPSDNFLLGFIQATSFNAYRYNVNEDRSTDQWVPSVNVQWDVTENSMLYASFSQGFKSGGFTAADDGEPGDLGFGEFPCVPGQPIEACYDPTNPNDQFEFDDENVDAYEIGGKHSLLEGGMTFNWAVFYTEYSDLQTSIFQGLGFGVTNAAQSEVSGVEADLLWQATDTLRIGISGSYLDATFQDFADAPCTAIQLDADPLCGTPNGFSNNDLSGEPTTYGAEYSASAFFNWNYPISNGMELFAGGEVNYRDEFNTGGDNDPLDVVPDFTKVNLRFGLRGEQWEVMAYGRNIFDEVVLVQGFDTPVLAGSHSYFIDEGAIFGGRLGFNF